MHLQIFTTSIWLYVKLETWNEMETWNELMEWTHGMDSCMEWTHGMDMHMDLWNACTDPLNGIMEWMTCL